MHGSFFLTHILDQIFGGIETSAFQSIVGLSASEAAEKAAGVNNALALELLVVGGMIAFFLIVRMTLSVEKPNPAQQIAEMVSEFTGGMGEQIIGHGYEKYQAFLTCIFLFVLFNNLIGLIPGVPAPTTSPWVPLGLALPTFIYYNYQGFREQGFIGYLKHFCGPLWWMAWLILPIELVSHFARIMSLTIRLYANMYASDMVTLGFFSLVPVGVPAIFLGLHAFVSVIQAFVFMLLTMIYISLATTHEN
jgi:F-type H+-transporting ATPase subunit a